MSEVLPSVRPAVVQELGDELLVYLPHGAQCHLLNPILTRVYRHCQEGATYEQVSAGLDPAVVESALDMLGQHRLLARAPSGP
ncbi:MAG: hypothetical protein KC910_32810, partial [Candidatus Eremiobacteraeota bacterium]|nr:hypothetical protein [Candidatus Eremiobacteraeota bacterium]